MLEVFFFLVEKRMQLVCTAFSTESRRPETGGSEKGTTETMVFEAAAAANAAGCSRPLQAIGSMPELGLSKGIFR